MRKKVQKTLGGATMKIAVQKTVFDGKEYYFFPFGWRVFFVTPELVKEDEGGNYIEFPLHKCDLKKLSGDIIIITEGTKTLLITTFESVQVETKIETNAEHYINYKYAKLIVGRIEDSTEIEETRVTTEVLILTEAEKIMIEWSSVVTLFLDHPKRGVRLLYSNGRVEDLPYVNFEILEKINSLL